VGIEALSNGAAEVVFVDASRDSCRMVEDNLAHLGFAARAQVVRADAVRELRFVGARVFDFIFMGPPYKDDQKKPLALTLPTLEALGAAGLAGPDTWVIGQHHKKEPVAPLPPGWVVFREKEYGDSVLTFFQRKA
jgi:16S rRNA (guanine966-N2)-methyltransferase